MWVMYSFRASWAPSFCWSAMNWAGLLMKAMKNSPPRSVPRTGSIPSVKE
jgi:hypothetical protein